MASFPDMSNAELMLICAAAAERASAFGRVLGDSEQRDWLSAGLELAWSAAAGNEVADECAELLDLLEHGGEEEGEEDPTSRPTFYADQALGLVGEALAVSIRPSDDRVETVLKTIRTLLSMVDFKLSGEKPVILKAGEPRPTPGPLVQAEQDAEQEILTIVTGSRNSLGDGRDWPSIVTAVRNSSSMFVIETTPLVGEFSEANNWS